MSQRHTSARVILSTLLCTLLSAPAPADDIAFTPDPLTRYIHVRYTVPADAPDTLSVLCEWSPPGAGQWRPAKVVPFVSETALNLATAADRQQWLEQGRLTERRAAGLERTVVFNPYPDAQPAGKVDVDFRVTLQTPDGATLATRQTRVQADNSDVVYLEDWTQVLQKDAVAADAAPQPGQWTFRASRDTATLGNDLYTASDPATAAPQLSYPLDLRGVYAIYVCSDSAQGGVGLRLSGDERTDLVSSRHRAEEELWRWCRMDRQHLVIRQCHVWTGWAAAHVDYVKLVPLPADLAADLDARHAGEREKFVAGYFEPYSWAFNEDIRDTLQHREPLTAFAEARIDLVDIQIGRFGMKSVYETRQSDPLYYSTIGDPIGHIAQPKTDNVGRMQQFTNTLDAELRYARELGLIPHANFGASNCYPGTPLQGDFSRQHPEWMRGSALRYEVPEVRQYVLGLYREALEIGAPGISIDFCRYPETIDSADTSNAILAELRALADDHETRTGRRVPILVRFPGTGVRLAENFDYAAWARNGWVDYLCPSNIQGRHLHIDLTPYFEAVKGTRTRLLPALDGLGWALDFPAPFLWRVQQLYAQGASGLYLYQADGRVLGRPGERRTVRMLASSDAVRRFWDEDARLRPQRSKAVFISQPNEVGGYHSWERLRLWPEGVPLGPMELYLDGQLVNRCDGPPYLLGTEDYASDAVIPPGPHELRVRIQDADAWLEQTFAINGA